jgi:site-specific DNA-methyltransferase (adenine-specific)
MRRLPDASVDLAFADPPFNIGYDYDIYDDRRDTEAYLNWTRDWGREIVRVLKPGGAFWLAIGDEFAAELKVLFHSMLGLSLRSWVIWYYTFGVHCKRKFARSHAHLFYFVKDPKCFTFNDQSVRVPSARQLVYADARANPKGRLPDDTWILRPQDLPQGFTADSDTWYFSRVCGTFKERAGWHGCQMPERLLGRIIEGCSNPTDTVLDPFAGSGTTLVVAKKLGRRYLGFELSPEYCTRVERRLKATSVGQPLEGVNAHVSGKPTPARTIEYVTNPAAPPDDDNELKRGLVAAFSATHDGFSVDRVIADPEFNDRFVQMCNRLGLPGDRTQWNQKLLNMRKSSYLNSKTRRITTFSNEEIDKYSFACEMAVQRLSESHALSLDGILCNPKIAAELDREVFDMAHVEIISTLTPLKVRWAALRIRKRMKDIKVYAMQRRDDALRLYGEEKGRVTFENCQSMPDCPGVYILQARTTPLYIGETLDLRGRINRQRNPQRFDFWGNPKEEFEVLYRALPVGEKQRFGQATQSLWIGRLRPRGNYEKLAVSDL